MDVGREERTHEQTKRANADAFTSTTITLTKVCPLVSIMLSGMSSSRLVLATYRVCARLFT